VQQKKKGIGYTKNRHMAMKCLGQQYKKKGERERAIKAIKMA